MCWPVCITALGHGPSADCMERRGSAGLFGYDTGTVDLSARMAALWCPHVTRASCLCMVKWAGKCHSWRTRNKPLDTRDSYRICIFYLLTYNSNCSIEDLTVMWNYKLPLYRDIWEKMWQAFLRRLRVSETPQWWKMVEQLSGGEALHLSWLPSVVRQSPVAVRGGCVTWDLNGEHCVVMIFSLLAAIASTYDVTHVLLEFQIRKRVLIFLNFLLDYKNCGGPFRSRFAKAEV